MSLPPGPQNAKRPTCDICDQNAEDGVQVHVTQAEELSMHWSMSGNLCLCPTCDDKRRRSWDPIETETALDDLCTAIGVSNDLEPMARSVKAQEVVRALLAKVVGA